MGIGTPRTAGLMPSRRLFSRNSSCLPIFNSIVVIANDTDGQKMTHSTATTPVSIIKRHANQLPQTRAIEFRLVCRFGPTDRRQDCNSVALFSHCRYELNRFHKGGIDK